MLVVVDVHYPTICEASSAAALGYFTAEWKYKRYIFYNTTTVASRLC